MDAGGAAARRRNPVAGVIVFLCGRASQQRAQTALAGLRVDAPSTLRIVDYPTAMSRRGKGLVSSSHVCAFGDLELLAPPDLEGLAVVRAELDARGCRTLNHPTLAMRPYELLRALHEMGVNPFDAYALTEGRAPRRYPAELRPDDGRSPAIGAPILDRAGFDAALAALGKAGRPREGILAVEGYDARDADGTIRLYSAIGLDGRIVPAELQHIAPPEGARPPSRRLDPDAAAEREAYLESNPHADALAALFETARIGFGRIDYCMVRGRPVVWRILTNPFLTAPARLDRLAQALHAIDPEAAEALAP